MTGQYGIYDDFDYYLHSIGWGSMAYVHSQVSGAIRAHVETFIAKDCYFMNNSNLKGGAIYLSKNENYEKQYVDIQNSIFVLNEAGDNGASIQFDNNIIFLKGNVTNCYFYKNLAWRI